MPTYVYETVDSTKPRRRFEMKQSMRDPALTQHPETGEPISRIISGGFGFASKGGAAKPRVGLQHSCGSGCGCR